MEEPTPHTPGAPASRDWWCHTPGDMPAWWGRLPWTKQYPQEHFRPLERMFKHLHESDLDFISREDVVDAAPSPYRLLALVFWRQVLSKSVLVGPPTRWSTQISLERDSTVLNGSKLVAPASSADSASAATTGSCSCEHNKHGVVTLKNLVPLLKFKGADFSKLKHVLLCSNQFTDPDLPDVRALAEALGAEGATDLVLDLSGNAFGADTVEAAQVDARAELVRLCDLPCVARVVLCNTPLARGRRLWEEFAESSDPNDEPARKKLCWMLRGDLTTGVLSAFFFTQPRSESQDQVVAAHKEYYAFLDDIFQVGRTSPRA